MTRYQAPIVDKTILVMTAVAESRGGATHAELSKALKIPRSTVYRILNSLVASRLVAKDATTPTFRLGPRILELARFVEPDDDRASLIDAARPIMADVVRRTGEACKLSVSENADAVVLHAVQSPSDYGLVIRIGRRTPLYAGGAGKALLAFQPASEINRILALPRASLTPSTITDGDKLLAALASIRRQGFAEDQAEVRSGIRSFAAPVFDAHGHVIAAISLPYVGSPVAKRTRLIRDSVIDGAKALSRALGWRESRGRRQG